MDACNLPTDPSRSQADVINRLLDAHRIAVVGLSDDPMRASFGVASYLKDFGKEIVPINPKHQTVMGLKCYARLEDVTGEIDLVNVFRRPEFCADVTRSAIAISAKGIWLQQGIRDETSKKLAAAAGIDYIENRCLMVDLMRRK